jgi:hypothetical protein
MWVISLCAWGKSYHEKLLKVALPSINAALGYANISDAQFYLYTDDPKAFAGAIFWGNVDFRPVDHARSLDHYRTYGRCDLTTLQTAPEDCRIAFLTSDILVNIEFFANAEKQFAQGKKAIIGSAARTLAAPEDCPKGLSARQLLDWSFSRERRHPVTEGCFWGRGRNLVAWCTYFEGPRGIVARAFHLHPFAVVNDRVLYFDKFTVDLDLIERFSYGELYVAVDPDEFAFAEISGLEKAIPQLPQTISVPSIVNWARHWTTPMQRWLFEHRIVVQGDGSDHLDEGPCEDILSLLRAMG